MTSYAPSSRPQLPSGDNKELLSAALSLVSQRAPWIARTMYRLVVVSHTAGYMATDTKGRIYIDFQVIHEGLDTRDKKVVRLATMLVTGLWRIARYHDARGENYSSGFARTEWDQASVAVATRDAITTITRSRNTDLPKGVLPEPVITVESITRDLGLKLDHSSSCSVEDVFDALTAKAMENMTTSILGDGDE